MTIPAPQTDASISPGTPALVRRVPTTWAIRLHRVLGALMVHQDPDYRWLFQFIIDRLRHHEAKQFQRECLHQAWRLLTNTPIRHRVKELTRQADRAQTAANIFESTGRLTGDPVRAQLVMAMQAGPIPQTERGVREVLTKRNAAAAPLPPNDALIDDEDKAHERQRPA